MKKLTLLTLVIFKSFLMAANSVICDKVLEAEKEFQLRSPVTISFSKKAGHLNAIISGRVLYKYSSIGFDDKFSTAKISNRDFYGIGTIERRAGNYTFTKGEVSGDSIGNARGSGYVKDVYVFNTATQELEYKELYRRHEERDRGLPFRVTKFYTLQCR